MAYRSRLRLAGVLVLALFAAGCAAAPTAGNILPPRFEPHLTSSKLVYQCPKVGNKAIRVDGKLDDAAWQQASAIAGFRHHRSDQPAAFPTTARVLWSDKYLFVSWDCKTDHIVAQHRQRDANLYEEEAAEIFVLPRGAEQIYYEFEFNPLNTIYDSRIENWRYEPMVKEGPKWLANYNPTFPSATMIHKDAAGKITGWSVEAAIPFSSMDTIGGKPPKVGEYWLFNVFRAAVLADLKTVEYSAWVSPGGDFHQPLKFPSLQFAGPVKR